MKMTVAALALLALSFGMLMGEAVMVPEAEPVERKAAGIDPAEREAALNAAQRQFIPQPAASYGAYGAVPKPYGGVPYGGVPSGPAPSGPAFYGPAPSGPAPYGPAPYGPAPYGPAPYGPALLTYVPAYAQAPLAYYNPGPAA
ncbi:hypothetical protein NDN08_005579 [Rhodosorus marinus]|uniref:Uncharacterized protein n=1 Tax=Rhodosorus marinus TaxID=101924 RepID=A0AAV8V2U3_9RHOD|nr:hypothetical protein NDN08_005579 [Rhodosorus marinus]